MQVIYEELVPVLGRDRVTVVCPRGTRLAEIREKFRDQDVYDRWFENSGIMHLEKKDLIAG